ncbi:MAG: dTMP kinase [Casimicrobiaceae bacterium]
MPVPDAENRRGRFITFEGIDGAGKSTHAAWFSAAIAARGHRVVATREPGGTPLGESLRDLLLNAAMTPETEALLMFAARREHVELVIRPALARGDWVLCDRFSDATYAYQGGGHGVSRKRIAELERFVQDDCRPDRKLLFDMPTTVSQARLAKASAQGRDLDKFEREERAFFDRVRKAYLARAAAEPERFYVIDAARPLPGVRADLERLLTTL